MRRRDESGRELRRAPHRWLSLAATVTAAALGLAPTSAHGQARERGADAQPPLQPAPRCTLRAHPLSIPLAAAAPDVRAQPAAAATSDGWLVAWRATGGGLYLARLGPTHERVAPDRELARPAGPFAMTPSPGGAAVAMVERVAGGGEAVLLARLSATGEARNVPRELARADAVDGVAVVWTGSGYVVAWGVRGGDGAGTSVVFTDARGVPRFPPRRLLDATNPRLVSLPNSDTVVLSAVSAAGDPTVAALDLDGSVTASSHWPASARGLVATPSGASVAAVSASVDPFAGVPFGLARWTLDAAATDTTLALRVAPGAQVASLAVDRTSVLVVVDEPAGREVIARVAPDGTATPLATRTGTLGVVVPGAEGALTVVGHEPAGAPRLAWVQLSCPRPVLFVPPSAPSALQILPDASSASDASASAADTADPDASILP